VNLLRKEILSRMKVESHEGGFAATLDVDEKLSILPDHFPDQPVLPGICMVQAVLLAGAKQKNIDELRVVRLKNVKLLQPVLPEQRVEIVAKMTEEDKKISIDAQLSVGGKRCAHIQLIAEEDRP